jgi:ketosteroid isomerase-like protein
MAHPNEILIREAYTAFQSGDLDAVQRQWTDDIRWHTPGRSPLSGDFEGAQQVLQLFGQLFELSGGTFRFDLHDVLANDEHAVGLLTVYAERPGKQPLNDNMTQIFHLRDGKVSEVWGLQTDLHAVEEFWS